ncbi:MAG: hypothetical protein ACREKL_10185 [Chthoniobacterales bacterium]
MKDVLVTLGLAVAIFLGFVIEEFIPPLSIVDGARVYLAPVFFCYGACVLPFPSMIVLALLAGFLVDFSTLQVVWHAAPTQDFDTVHNMAASVEISPGWSILLFVAFGLICQGFRPLVLRGHWWLPALMSAALTVVQLGLQFGVITIRRFEEGGLFWSETVAWRIFAPGLVALLLSLVLFLIVTVAENIFYGDRRPLRDY